jgi:hypothetical protein
MYTVIESTTFQKQVADIWGEDELTAFIDWLAENPLVGDVVPGTQGLAKSAGRPKARANARAPV